MAYALDHGVPIEDDLRGIMSRQLSNARDELVAVTGDPDRAVHQCRRRCKKIRAAIRLVRPAVVGDGYATVNGLARDAARELAPFRDATAMATTVERLRRGWSGSNGTSGAMDRVGAALSKRRDDARYAASSGHPAVDRARSLLAELSDAIDEIELDDDGADAIRGGLAKTYGRGRDALSASVEAPTGSAFHEWRKRAKYTRHHVHLLAPAAPTILDPLEDAFHDLTDALGDSHDLVVLGQWLRSDADDVQRLGDTTDLRVVVDGLRSELEVRAVSLGRRLYAESTKRFTARLAAYWEVWEAESTRHAAGDLDDVLS